MIAPVIPPGRSALVLADADGAARCRRTAPGSRLNLRGALGLLQFGPS
jgi:hypothetical protein